MHYSSCWGIRGEPVMALHRLITVIDDDESVRHSLPNLLRQIGFAVRAFSSATEFLASDAVAESSCLILDVKMPGMSGPDLQRELKWRARGLPIIFITACPDESVRQPLLKQGAVECLFKPFTETALFEAIDAALETRRH
jgi:FixJ family two-component response regulator